jgi:uroporphyrinogen-III synthase
MQLIVTRPEPDASRTAQALLALGHEPILSPMLDIVLDTTADLPNVPVQAVLATSSNAVRAMAAHRDRSRLIDLPFLAVGDRTALEAKRAGFRKARSAGGAVGDLAELALAELDPGGGPLLYAAGDVHSDDLAGMLTRTGFIVSTAVVYRARARSRLAEPAAAAFRRGTADGVLLYSRRSADAFALALVADGLAPLQDRVTCFCLSPAVAEALPAVSSGPILIASRPDQISLLALFERMPASSEPG